MFDSFFMFNKNMSSQNPNFGYRKEPHATELENTIYCTIFLKHFGGWQGFHIKSKSLGFFAWWKINFPFFPAFQFDFFPRNFVCKSSCLKKRTI